MIHDIQRTSSPANVNPANNGTTVASTNTSSRNSGPMQVMLSRQAEMHRILLEEHQKLQKSHHQLCEKLMLETRQLVNNKNNNIRGRANGRTFTRSPAPTTTTSVSMSGTRIPRSVSLQRISASKSVMDLRFVSDRVNHHNQHHHSQANLNQNSGDEHEEDDDGDSDDHHADHHVNELRQQLERLVDQLRESKDQNELLEFRILELEKMNEELIEQQSSPSSSSSTSSKFNNNVICTGRCLNHECILLRERLDVLEGKEKESIEENMKLQMEVVALKDEICLLMESRDAHQCHADQLDHVSLCRAASHQMSSSEDEGLADLEVRMRRDSVNDHEDRIESPAAGVEESSSSSSSASTSSSSASTSSYCPIMTRNNNDSSSGSIAGSESGISGSLLLDSGTQTESEPLSDDCDADRRLEKRCGILSPLLSDSPAPSSTHMTLPPTSSSALLLLAQPDSSSTSQTGQISSGIDQLSAASRDYDVSEKEKALQAALVDVRNENAVLKEVNERLLRQTEELTEQVLELEEAENDARSMSQKLQSQVTSLVNQMDSLQVILLQERESLQKKENLIKHYEEKIKEFLNSQPKQYSGANNNSNNSKCSSNSNPAETIAGRQAGVSKTSGTESRCSLISSSAESTTGSNESIDSISDDTGIQERASSSQMKAVNGRRGRTGNIWNKIHRFEKKIRIRIKSNLTVNGKKDPSSLSQTSVSSCSPPAHVSSIAVRAAKSEEEYEEEGEDDLLQDEREGKGLKKKWEQEERGSPVGEEESDGMMRIGNGKNGEEEGEEKEKYDCMKKDTLTGSSVNHGMASASAKASNSGVDEDEGVDDLQVFISEKEMMRQDIGSSFEVSAFHHHPKNYLPSRKNRHHHLLLTTAALTSTTNHHHQQQHDVHSDSDAPHEVKQTRETTTGLAEDGTGSTSSPAVHMMSHASSLQTNSSSLPLCETIKPLRIDINNRHQTNVHVLQHQHQHQQQQRQQQEKEESAVKSCTTSSPVSAGRNVIISISNGKRVEQQDTLTSTRNTCTQNDSGAKNSQIECENKQPLRLSSASINCISQMSHCMAKLEQNERLLRDKLIKLEWINKEFVNELELRERILNSKETDYKELQIIRSTFSQEIHRLQSQLQELHKQAVDITDQRDGDHHQHPNDSDSNDRESTNRQEIQGRELRLLSELKQKEEEFNLIKKSFEEKRQKLEAEHEAVVVNLMMRMKDMETESVLTVKQMEEQRSRICHELETCVKELQLKEVFMNKKISSLEQELSCLKSKASDDSRTMQWLRDELRDAREREEAFKETINRADQIIFDAEKGYKEKIDGLKENEARLLIKIEQLQQELDEEVKCASWSAKLAYDSESCGDRMPNELESSLRETITRLEESEHLLKNKIKCLENERNELLIELQENEQVINKNTHLQRDYESLKKEFTFLKSYKSDLEELLKNQSELFTQKESDLLKQINTLKKDRSSLEIRLNSLRSELEQHICTSSHNKDTDTNDGEIIENSRL